MNSRFIASPFPWQLDEADWTSIRWKKKNFRPEFVNSRRYRHLTLCPGNLSFESSRTNNPYNFRFLVLFLPFLPFFPPPLFSFRFLFYSSIPSISFSFPDDVLFIIVVVVFFFLPEKSAFHEWRFYAHKFHWTGQQKDLYISRGLRRDASSNDDTVFSFNRSNSFFFSLFFFSFFPTANYCLRLTMLHHFPQLPFLPLPSPPFPFFLSFFLSFRSSLQARSRLIAKIDISIVSWGEKSEFAWGISAHDANIPRTYPGSLGRAIHVNGSIACRADKEREKKKNHRGHACCLSFLGRARRQVKDRWEHEETRPVELPFPSLSGR